MRWTAIACVLTVACGAAPADSADAGPGPDAVPFDPSAELYDPAVVPRFELTLDPAAVAALETDPRTYARATLRYGAEVVTDIGVHIKGEWNFRPLSAKAAWKLKFDAFVPGQRFHGLARMTLNNALEDPSWVAERLTYDLYRGAALPAPRANAAWVTVNGAAYGLYINVETEDRHLLARWFADPSGNLYEETGAEFEPGNEDGFELETNEAVADKADLTRLFAAVAGASDATFQADVGAVLDLPAFLRYCAYEAAVWQWDGYCYTRFGPNNFRTYHEPTRDQFYLLPWGMDMSWKPHEPTLDIFDARGLVLERCLAIPGCRAAYRVELAAVADRLDTLDLPARVDAYAAQARALVALDPRKEIDDARFEETVATVRAVAAGRAADLRAQVGP
ncbi:MAG: CotH kinase family protein [Myxococcales bacterium]|nr:CotH kinase family protein [Myxococcales bacterium]